MPFLMCSINLVSYVCDDLSSTILFSEGFESDDLSGYSDKGWKHG